MPYLVLHALSIVSACAMGFGEVVNASLIGVIASNVIFFFLLYAMAAVTTILCGNTVITLLLGLWVYFGPTLVTALWQGLKSLFFQTYVTDASMFSLLFCNKFAPLIQYFGVNGTKMHVYTMDYAAGLQEPSAIGLPDRAMRLRRSLSPHWRCSCSVSERVSGRAQHWHSTRSSCPSRLLSAWLWVRRSLRFFKMLVYESELWFWVGLVLGTVIFHCVVEIIYAFDFRAIFRKPLQMVIILAVLAVGLLLMRRMYSAMINGCRMRAALQRQRRWVTSVNRHCSVSRKTSRQRGSWRRSAWKA